MFINKKKVVEICTWENVSRFKLNNVKLHYELFGRTMTRKRRRRRKRG